MKLGIVINERLFFYKNRPPMCFLTNPPTIRSLEMKVKLLQMALIILVAVCPIFVHTQSTTQPNVLLILADDLGSIDLNCYGANDLATPNLDRLAQRGIRFTQFYAAAPVCSPSRAALLTGKTNLGVGLPGNVPIPENDPEMKKGLPSQETTIAEMVKNEGYYTILHSSVNGILDMQKINSQMLKALIISLAIKEAASIITPISTFGAAQTNTIFTETKKRFISQENISRI